MKKTRYNAQHSRRFRVNLRKVLCFGLVLVMAATMLPASTPAALAQGPDEEVSMTEAAAPAGEMPVDLEETMPADEPPTDSIAEPNIAFAEMQNLSSIAPVELQDEPETASIEPQNESDTASAKPQAEPNTAPAELQDEPSTETTEPQDEPEEDTDKQEDTVYANSISGALWLDVFEDKDSGAHNGDGVRQPEEEPFADYEVSLYLADDKESPVDTVTTDSNGAYIFENLEPGTYVVGLSACTKDDVEYLLPIVGINDNTQFFSDYNEDYTTVYSKPIAIDADTVVTDIDVGMRTPMGIQPVAATLAYATVNSLGVNGTAPHAQMHVPASNAGIGGGGWHYIDLTSVTVMYCLAGTGTKNTWTGWTTAGTASLSKTQLSFYNFDIPNLSPGTSYDVQLYFGYGQGKDTSGAWDGVSTFTTKTPPPPTIDSFYPEYILQRDAQLRGIFTGQVDRWEFQIAKSGDPFDPADYGSYIITNCFGTNTFGTWYFKDFFTLEPNTSYYVRLIAHNAGGSSTYDIEFRTLPDPPTIDSFYPEYILQRDAQLRGTFTGQVDRWEFQIAKSGDPFDPADYGSYIITNCFGTNTFGTWYFKDFFTLEPNTSYYVRLIAHNAGGSSTYDIEFRTLPDPLTIDSFYPAWITKDDAQTQGNYSSATSITGYNLYLSDNGGASWLAPTGIVVNDAFGAGTFLAWNFDFYGWKLHPNSAYVAHIYAWNAGGRSLQPGEYNIITLPDFTSWQITPDSADATKATVSGTYAGDQPITAATIRYGTSETDVNTDAPGTTLLTGGTDFTFDNDDFSANLTGLTPGQTYYVKTTVTNATGTTTSTIKSFETYVQFTVSNTVIGSYADKTKDFTFTLTMTDNADVPLSGASVTHAGGTLLLDGNGQATFTLKHGESIAFTDILGTSKILVEETLVTGYTASHVLDSGGVPGGHDTGFISVNSLDHTAAFTNERGNIVPTGVNTGNLQGMYVIIAGGVTAAVLAGLCILLYRSKRKRRYE